MKKIIIIGAGISGLTCAWRLAQKGINSIILEKDWRVGGRTLFSGAVSPGEFDKNLNKLIKEMKLEEIKVPLRQREIAFFTKEGEMINYEDFQREMREKFGLIKGLKLWRIFQFINSLNFDLSSPDEKILALRKVSFNQFLKKYPPEIQQVLRETACFFGETEIYNPERMSAEYGLNVVRLANELCSDRAFSFEDENILNLCNLLSKKLEDQGSEILTSCEVKLIEKKENKFIIVYQKENREEKIESNLVVLATPLYVIPKIFPQLNLETDINYLVLDCYTLEGELKYPEIKVIKGDKKNPAQIAIGYNIVPTYQTFVCLEGIQPDFSFLYHEWKIISKKTIPALPIIGPKSKVPSLKTEIKGAFLCGDFYYHTFLETAVTTAEMTARLLLKELNLL